MMYCPKGKLQCPLADMSGDGHRWCGDNHYVYEWEGCPMPKRRDKKIKQVERFNKSPKGIAQAKVMKQLLGKGYKG